MGHPRSVSVQHPSRGNRRREGRGKSSAEASGPNVHTSQCVSILGAPIKQSMSTLIDARRRRVARGCTVVLRVPPSLESRESIWTDPVTRCARVMNHPESGDQARPLPGSNDALSTWENRETASELSWRIDMAGASARDKRARTSTSRQVGDPGPAASACTCALPDSPGVLVPAEPVVAAAAPLGPARPRTRARAPALSLSRGHRGSAVPCYC